MNKSKLKSKVKTFNFRDLPECVYQRRAKTQTGTIIAFCTARKGIGNNNHICAHYTVEPTCKSYVPKKKFGRSLLDMAGDLVNIGDL